MMNPLRGILPEHFDLTPEDAAERERLVKAVELELAKRRARRSALAVMAKMELARLKLNILRAERVLRRRALRLSDPAWAADLDRIDREKLWYLYGEYRDCKDWKRRVRIARRLFPIKTKAGGPSR